MPPLSFLFAYAARYCRFDSSAYYEPGFASLDDVRAYRADKATRDRHRVRVLRRFAGRVKSDGELIPGRYYGTRLLISADGSIEYIPGQFAAMEIWHAIEAYLEATN